MIIKSETTQGLGGKARYFDWDIYEIYYKSETCINFTLNNIMFFFFKTVINFNKILHI